MRVAAEMAPIFIRSAVRVVARDGLERTTTKAISREADLNETYIYWCFKSKDELLREAFLEEDVNFVQFLDRNLAVMNDLSLSWKERAFILWKKSWDFILEDADDCRFYLRYYYSATYMTNAVEKHNACYRPLIERVKPAFRPETPVSLLIRQIFDNMLCFALRVMNGEVENNETLVRWFFEQIYVFVAPHIRPERLGNGRE